MHITAKKDVLLDYLSVVQKAIPARTPLNVLKGILMQAEDGQLNFTATDMEFLVQANAVQADTWREGKIVIPPEFIQILKYLPDDMVTIEMLDEEVEEGKMKARITSGEAFFILNGMNPEDYPRIECSDKNISSFQIKSCNLKDILNKTLLAVSRDNSISPLLQGVYIEVNEDDSYCMATDGFRIAYYSLNGLECEPFQALIPYKKLAEIARIIDNSDTVVNCYVTDKEIKFIYRQFTISVRLMDGRYPNLKKVFSNNCLTKIKINTSLLEQALARAILIGKNTADGVHLKISNNNLNIKIQSELGSMDEDLKISQEGEDVDITFNPHYLIEPLSTFQSDEIEIEFNGKLGPCIIKNTQGNYKYLVLPIKIS